MESGVMASSWGKSWLLSWANSWGSIATSKGLGGSRRDYEAYRKELERIIKISEKRFEKPEEAPIIVKAKIPPKVKKAVQVYNKAQPKVKRIEIDYGLEIDAIQKLFAYFDALVIQELERQRLQDEEDLIIIMAAI